MLHRMACEHTLCSQKEDLSMSKAPTRNAVTADDLKRIQLVSDPQAQPGGSLVAWVVTRIEEDNDTYAGAIWIGEPDGSNARQLTVGAHRDSSPCWSPDGTTIAFISNRPTVLQDKQTHSGGDEDKNSSKDEKKDEIDADAKPKPQIWTIRIDGGEAQQVTNHPNGASSPSWSPDGNEIAFAASDDVDVDDDISAPTSTGSIADERVVRDMSYRFDGRGWLEKYSHIWKVSIDTREATQLTFGDVNDIDPRWSPAGGFP